MARNLADIRALAATSASSSVLAQDRTRGTCSEPASGHSERGSEDGSPWCLGDTMAVQLLLCSSLERGGRSWQPRSLANHIPLMAAQMCEVSYAKCVAKPLEDGDRSSIFGGLCAKPSTLIGG